MPNILNASLSRRRLVGGLAIVAVGAVSACQRPPSSVCGASVKSHAEVQLRQSLNYTDPSPNPGQVCGGCAFFTGAEGDCGACSIVSGEVSARGHCSSWAARPA